MKETQTGLDYGNDKISRLFRKMFYPTLLGLIFNTLLTIVDGIFVGQGVGPDGIAAVNIIAPLYMVVTGTGLMFGIGSSVVAGIAIARNDNRRASVNVSQAFAVSGLMIAAIVSVLAMFPRGVAAALGSSEVLMPHAVDYLTWLLPGMFFLVLQCIGMMVIRLDGSPKFAMMCNIVPAVLNIVLDYYLVFPCAMGVMGAAIATSISIIVGSVMVFVYFVRFSYVIRFVRSMRGVGSNLWRQVRIGSSSFVTEIAMSIMMFTGNIVFMRYYGDAGVAAFSIACYLFPLIFMMSNAVAQSAQPIISFNHGADNRARVSEAFRLSLRVALVCGIIAGGIIAGGARILVSLFIDPECPAGRLAVSGLPIYATCAVFFAANISFIGYYQSVERTLRAMVFTLLRGVVILVPMFFVMPVLFPGWGIWATIPATELLTLLILATSTRR